MYTFWLVIYFFLCWSLFQRRKKKLCFKIWLLLHSVTPFCLSPLPPLTYWKKRDEIILWLNLILFASFNKISFFLFSLFLCILSNCAAWPMQDQFTKYYLLLHCIEWLCYCKIMFVGFFKISFYIICICNNNDKIAFVRQVNICASNTHYSNQYSDKCYCYQLIYCFCFVIWIACCFFFSHEWCLLKHVSHFISFLYLLFVYFCICAWFGLPATFSVREELEKATTTDCTAAPFTNFGIHMNNFVLIKIS